MSTTCGAWLPIREPLSDSKSIHARQADVEQHDGGTVFSGQIDGRLPILGLGHHSVAVSLEEGASGRSKVGMVINDEDSPWHARIMLYCVA